MNTAAAEASAPARYHPRVPANLMVTVHTQGRSLVVKARDLSMNGLFLWGIPGFSARRVTVSIPLPNGRDVTASCDVTRAQKEGVALRFADLDWDDLIALARYLHPRLP